MPLNLAEFGITYQIQKICGQEKQRHYLESLGFTEGSEVMVISELHGYYVVKIMESRIGLERSMAQRIVLVPQ